ncbi:hypothetical protein MGYG_03330 [Nannizzia gypsea CBS 118893]|uniref:Uncharacterized protein n=1 Tax=Arthroderma gypseum (strain ATCC MYA-4604 / CBS 118893) TaxID=535722 RepID=E4UN26_ARTGP|nr:hypothetical protein MGYG_03330 [Nannizzia gypsea CBS 118893]EFR00328.1 hypothetical protein MGYG_03330 [Nannizzia gypsea CBS 118893]
MLIRFPRVKSYDDGTVRDDDLAETMIEMSRYAMQVGVPLSGVAHSPFSEEWILNGRETKSCIRNKRVDNLRGSSASKSFNLITVRRLCTEYGIKGNKKLPGGKTTPPHH